MFERELNRLIGESDRVCIVGPLFDGDRTIRDPAVFVDGGSRFREAGRGLSVGDGDSFSGELDHRLPVVKDYSDLAFVLASLPGRVKRLDLFGFLGGRRDHELINLGETHRYLQQRRQNSVWFDSAVIGLSAGIWRESVRGLFSLFAFEPTEITLTGACEYPIAKPRTLSAGCSLGLSNVGTGEVDLTVDGTVFLFLNH